MFHPSDPVGIIPMNATPGKACGATLGEICNTSEVRGRWPYNLLLCSVFHLCLPANAPLLSPQFYLSYHLYIVALAGAGATVIALVSPAARHPADNALLKICMLPWRAYQLLWQRRLSLSFFAGVWRQPSLSSCLRYDPAGCFCTCVRVCVSVDGVSVSLQRGGGLFYVRGNKDP